MTRFLRAAFLAAGLMASAWPVAPAAAAVPAATTNADARLRALYDGYSAWAAKEGGFFEDKDGEQKPLGYLPHVDAQTQLRQAAHLQDLLNQLNAIPQKQLSPDEQVNAAIFRTVLEN